MSTKIILYPIYFDSDCSRPTRRISKQNAIPNVTIQNLQKVLNFLKINYKEDYEKIHPQSFFNKGRIEIDKGYMINELKIGTKTGLIKLIGDNIKKYKDDKKNMSTPENDPNKNKSNTKANAIDGNQKVFVRRKKKDKDNSKYYYNN